MRGRAGLGSVFIPTSIQPACDQRIQAIASLSPAGGVVDSPKSGVCSFWKNYHEASSRRRHWKYFQ